MKRSIFWLAVLVACSAALYFSSQALAQKPTPSDNDVNAVARELYCPVCENIPLEVCPTAACMQWRALIREKLADGWDKQQIKDYFALQYGDRVLAEPPMRGLNWMVYVVPPVLILIGGVLVFSVLRSMRKSQAARPPSPPPAQPEGTDEYLERIEEELKRRSTS